MSNITVTIRPSLDRLAKAFGSVDVPSFISEKAKELAFMVEREAKLVTPVDTGRLRSSIFTKGIPLGAIVSTNVEYAAFVHEGTRYMRGRPFMELGVRHAGLGFGNKIARDLEMRIDKKLP